MPDQVDQSSFPVGDRAQPDAQTMPESTMSEPALPEPVRQRVITLAATAMTSLPAAEMPVSLRRVAKFAPNRRARLGAGAISTQLSADPLFRQRIGTLVTTDAGDLGAAVQDGVPPAAADPVEVAALAYLIRPDNWRELVEEATAAALADVDLATLEAEAHAQEQRAARAEHERALARVEADKLRDEVARLRDDVAGLREENRSLAKQLRDTLAREKRASDLLATERGRIARTANEHDAEVRRLRARLADAEAAALVSRASAKEARQVDDARLWLLLETIGQAASGLRRELALEPTSILPGDIVADASADRPGRRAQAEGRALEADDPIRLDRLLALPKAHLIIDGYNVTKSGFGEMSLEQQRTRLISAMAGLAAQTGAEVTVVFDGAERLVGLPPGPRSVRVLFSRKGETADDLIRRLVRAEPAGRPIVVISSDREVADGVRRHGAYPLSSETLIRRMSRV
jgi:predicted RNA-binding protein with PIN domain